MERIAVFIKDDVLQNKLKSIKDKINKKNIKLESAHLSKDKENSEVNNKNENSIELIEKKSHQNKESEKPPIREYHKNVENKVIKEPTEIPYKIILIIILAVLVIAFIFFLIHEFKTDATTPVQSRNTKDSITTVISPNTQTKKTDQAISHPTKSYNSTDSKIEKPITTSNNTITQTPPVEKEDFST